MKQLKLRLSGTLVICVTTMIFLSAGLSAKASFVINNASFEDPSTSTYTSGSTINGWEPIVGPDGGGVWNINADALGFWTAPAPAGNQVGWLSSAPNGGSTTVQQTLTANVVVGYTYKFTGSVGHPIGYGASKGTIYTVSIMSGGVVVASSSGTGPEGSFVPFSVVWTGDGAHVGQALGIRLGTSQAQTAFDNLSMVPEPTTMIAGGLLLLPFGASTFRMLRKKRMA
jgi:hypothetical protein